MKFTCTSALEPLEARIAPARVILVNVPDGGVEGVNDVNYTDSDPLQAFFVNTETGALHGDTISGQVGGGVAGVADTFYLRLSAGDVLKMYNNATGPQEYLKVKSGNIVAFFTDINGDNEVNPNELTGIAMGKGASFVLHDDIAGDIVGNLDEHGTKNLADDDLSMDKLVSGKQSIAGVEVTAGSVAGSIIAGGGISNVKVEGTVSSILTGTAANGKTFDFYPTVSGGDGTINFTPDSGVAGGSIKNVFVNGIGTSGSVDPFNGLLKAGTGGTGAAGGGISSVQINSDFDGFTIQSGDGGNAPGKAGAGGTLSKIYISGTPDSSVDEVKVLGGAGGISGNAAGGAGGALKNVYVGYRLFGTTPFPTDFLLQDKTTVEGGAGGTGKTGGAGGSVNVADIRVKTPEGAGDEIVIQGGSGGASVISGGKGGVGGGVLNSFARNQDLGGVNANAYSDTLIQGGDGGMALVAGSSGGSGGAISKVTLLGWEVKVKAGNGADGKIGGGGGAVNSILLEKGEGIRAYGADISGGFGGSGNDGSGGVGGTVNGVRVVDSDLASFTLNGGRGGDGNSGKGGAGGSVLGFDLLDSDFSNGTTQTVGAPVTIRAGAGGSGAKGGGVGGSVKQAAMEGENINVECYSGAGGNVLVGGSGKGGNGGSFDTVSVVVSGDVNGGFAYSFVEAGAGGDGVSAGGAGGNARSASLIADGDVHVYAGTGGNAQPSASGAVGAGGSIVNSQIISYTGKGAMIAGNAGANGSKPGVGGSITGLSAETRAGVFAQGEILIQAGDGSQGGAGGSVKLLAYGSSNIEFTPAPFGNITVKAGNGSGGSNTAGAGGSIIDVAGSLASEDPNQIISQFTTSFVAGNGGTSPNKGGAGGSIKGIDILNGGFFGADLKIKAGDAGDSFGNGAGAKGGDVSDLQIGEVGDGTVFHSIVAGKGGNSASKGGAGGSIKDIAVLNLDIGSRYGGEFGVDGMGGLFVGVGGFGATSGVNGSVVNVTANGIGSIVAGTAAAPQAAELVSNVVLNGTATLKVSNPSDFDTSEPGKPFDAAYAIANIIGFYSDPSANDATTFHYRHNNVVSTGAFMNGDEPIDGLILAKKASGLAQTPEAYLIGSIFYDWNNII